MNKFGAAVLASLLFSFAVVAKDRLEVYEDYDLGKAVYSLTTVKVDPNMGDVYLAGLQQSWVKAVTIQKELGFIEDFSIYGSDLPQSGDFNMILLVKFASGADAEPSKEKYMQFMKKWGEKNQKTSQKVSAKYPEVRTITGEYMMREIMMK